ncbi:hypothetical protein A2V71_04180 [Candidatus Berkelbacteria bacterium RBG_13_40_8]|uniref:DNA polymerase III subunit delta n=1 Tax=Candidatus Berkelbacteria bacterium RBG_13_40_8 TaxID=1797467 RepID=A0A1F5DNL4_9BACT|nr:MAG: hypothetical protein A2V71_04180 [Candidatus Berkelbacteria bacterium RBG_13_40_8]
MKFLYLIMGSTPAQYYCRVIEKKCQNANLKKMAKVKYLTKISSKNSWLLIGKLDISELKRSFNVSEIDFFLLSEAIKITDIRELIHWINLKPLHGDIKLTVILGAERMTTEASNALLKTLEEPPRYASIILVTSEEKKILPTIASRCQKVRIPLMENVVPPEEYLSPEELSKMSIKEKFQWVGKVSEQNDVALILTLWQDYYRKKLLSGENVLEELKEISKAKDLLGTNISVKLLLENLTLIF